jgi:hypothetical protein
MQGYGYTVYDYPDDAHLLANPAEDHCPFSDTGFPSESPYGRGMATDLMPHSDPKMPTLVQIGLQMYNDKMAGHPALAAMKYQNWTDTDNNCWHDKWQYSHVRSSSTDRGHQHNSYYTDYVDSNAMTSYDPIARLRGKKGKKMRAYKASDNDTVYLGDGITCRSNFTWEQFKYMIDLGLIESPPSGQPTAGADKYDAMVWVLIPGQVENYAGVLIEPGSVALPESLPTTGNGTFTFTTGSIELTSTRLA